MKELLHFSLFSFCPMGIQTFALHHSHVWAIFLFLKCKTSNQLVFYWFLYPRVSRPRWRCESEGCTAEPSAGGGPNTARGEECKNMENSSLLTANTVQHYTLTWNYKVRVKKRLKNASIINYVLLNLLICTQNTKYNKTPSINPELMEALKHKLCRKTLFFPLWFIPVESTIDSRIQRMC